MSHPVWVRGLKHACTQVGLRQSDVAPRVGAWIETTLRRCFLSVSFVAPRVGAWIETQTISALPQKDTRRTPCGCVD